MTNSQFINKIIVATVLIGLWSLISAFFSQRGEGAYTQNYETTKETVHEWLEAIGEKLGIALRCTGLSHILVRRARYM